MDQILPDIGNTSGNLSLIYAWAQWPRNINSISAFVTPNYAQLLCFTSYNARQ